MMGLQRIKGAIDRTIAEEQARQEQARKALGPDSGTPRRSDSTSRGNQSPARRPRPKKNVSQDNTKDGDSPSNPDPAVFEAAFVLDDSEEPSRAGTPKPPAMEDKTDEKKEKVEEAGQNGDEKKEGDAGAATAAPAAAPELSPEVRTKLRKLEKLEKTYPGGYNVSCCKVSADAPQNSSGRTGSPTAAQLPSNRSSGCLRSTPVSARLGNPMRLSNISTP